MGSSAANSIRAFATVGRTFRLFFRHPGFYLLTAVALTLPVLLSTIAIPVRVYQQLPEPSTGPDLFVVILLIIQMALSFICGALITAFITLPTLHSLQKGSLSFYATFPAAIAAVPTVIWTVLLATLVFVVGFIISLIPAGVAVALATQLTDQITQIMAYIAAALLFLLGFFYFCRLTIAIAIATPIAAVEGTGAYRSIKKSARCTKGNRFRIFVAYLLLLALYGGLILASSLAAGLITAYLDVPPATLHHISNGVGWLSGALLGSLISIYDVIIYERLTTTDP